MIYKERFTYVITVGQKYKWRWWIQIIINLKENENTIKITHHLEDSFINFLLLKTFSQVFLTTEVILLYFSHLEHPLVHFSLFKYILLFLAIKRHSFIYFSPLNTLICFTHSQNHFVFKFPSPLKTFSYLCLAINASHIFLIINSFSYLFLTVNNSLICLANFLICLAQ